MERIFEERSPSAATMRAIATEAGCSLGVSYRYFDSKDELLGAALDRMATRITATSTGVGDPAEALLGLWQAFDTTPAFPRLVTWMISEGMDVTSAMSGHPLILKVADTARARGSEDPQTAAGVMALLVLAGAGYGPAVNRALSRDPADQTLYNATAQMFESWIEHPDIQTS
ncbi:MAG: TetR/AcrR family transcriptional regulator [Actinomycetia bacterium]|nr:TetR/AcrR family transcriptional regulator [Actinomycetes bacterium]